jgi:hypothetical protein
VVDKVLFLLCETANIPQLSSNQASSNRICFTVTSKNGKKKKKKGEGCFCCNGKKGEGATVLDRE